MAVIDRPCAGESWSALTGIARDVPIVATVAQALTYAPNVLAIAIAPAGGVPPHEWQQEIKQAVVAGLSIINGLHTPLATVPELRNNLREGQFIWNVRREPSDLTIGSGRDRFHVGVC